MYFIKLRRNGRNDRGALCIHTIWMAYMRAVYFPRYHLIFYSADCSGKKPSRDRWEREIKRLNYYLYYFHDVTRERFIYYILCVYTYIHCMCVHTVGMTLKSSSRLTMYAWCNVSHKYTILYNSVLYLYVYDRHYIVARFSQFLWRHATYIVFHVVHLIIFITIIRMYDTYEIIYNNCKTIIIIGLYVDWLSYLNLTMTI